MESSQLVPPPPPVGTARRDGARPSAHDGARRLRLLARIRRHYATVTEPIDVGPLRLTFTRVADPDLVLDEMAEAIDRRERATGHREDDVQHLPYWAELWDSAVGMGKWIVERWGRGGAANGATPSSEASRAVLDLGCGMGLSGTVAAAVGARVLFADLEPPALLFARLNSLPFADRVRARLLNWQTDRLGETFDTILGADILYDKTQWAHLDPFWRAHLGPGGYVLLGEPGRQTGDLFVGWAGERGWTIEPFEVPVATRPRPVRIFRLTT